MSGDILYPKPLDKLVFENKPLPSGFLPNEVVALKHIWRILKRRLYYHISNIFIELYSDNAFLLEKFLINNRLNCLHSHKRQLINIYEQLIDSGFSDMIFINTILGEVSQHHRAVGVTIEDITLQTRFIEQYIKAFLHKVMSAAAINGLNKLSELILEHHRDKKEPEQKLNISKRLKASILL